MHRLHLRNHQIPFTKIRPDLQLIGARPSTQDTTGKVNRRKWELSQKRRRNIHLPPSRLHLHDPSDYQIPDFRGIPGAQSLHGKQLVGFLNMTGNSGDDRRR